MFSSLCLLSICCCWTRTILAPAPSQLAAIENHLRELPRITLAQRSDVPRTIAHEMRGAAANAHPARLAFCESGARTGLIELTDTITSSATELSDAVADAYFQHASRIRTGSSPFVEA